MNTDATVGERKSPKVNGFLELILLGCLVALVGGLSAPLQVLAATYDIDVGPSGTNTFSVVSSVVAGDIGTNHITVNIGDEIRWTWRSPNHSVTSSNGVNGPSGAFPAPASNCSTTQAFRTPIQGAPNTFTENFTVGATPLGLPCQYYCEFHSGPNGAGMGGTITVRNPVNNRTLTVTKAGTGFGTVTSSPGAINCGVGPACSDIFTSGESVTLTATTFPGSTVTGFSGDCVSATTQCTFIITADSDVTVTFDTGAPSGGTGPIISLASGQYSAGTNADLVVGVSVKNQLTAYLGNGAGGFSAGQVITDAITSPFASTSGGVAGYFNGDLLPDLVVANNGSKTVKVFLGTGTGTPGPSPSNAFQIPAVSTLTLADGPTGLATADFDNDGKLDLAVATVGTTGNVLIFRGNGDGTFISPPVTTIPISITVAGGVSVTSVVPNTVGCLGLPINITVTGALFIPGSTTFSLNGTIPLSIFSISADATTAVLTVPTAGVTAGVHDVIATLGANSSDTGPGSKLTVNPRVTTISSIAPNSQVYGISPSAQIDIFGSGFVLGGTVTVGSVSGTTVAGSNATAGTPFVFVSSGLVRVYLSNTALATGSYAVSYANADACGGSATVSPGFYVTAPQPTVNSLVLPSVTYGISPAQSVTILGSNFVLGATISVGSLSGTTVAGFVASAGTPFVFVNSVQLLFYWANISLPPGSYSVTVTNPVVAGGLSATRPAGFTVTAPVPAPTSLTPNNLIYGVSASQQVTIIGSNFISGATITVGGITGATVPGTSATAATPFVFQNSSQVSFFWNNTALAPASYGVIVTNPPSAGGASGTLAAGFTVQAGQPSVASASPSPQTYGINPSTSITIVGSNFVLGATITVGALSGVTVAGSTATVGTPFVFVNSSQVLFYWPNTSLVPGSYAVQVTNPAISGGLSGVRVGGFVVTAPQPTVSFAAPSPQTYGINPSGSITIVGSNFILGATVTVGSLSGATVAGGNATAGTPFVYVSSGELRFYWPNTALGPGSYTIGVTNPVVAGGLSGSRVGGFVVTAPQPTVSFASPSPQTYGINPSASVTIVGSNFILGATITVGSLSGATVVGGNATAGVPFVHVSSGELRFYWPNTALAPGSYTIGVTNPAVAGGLSGSRVGGFVVTAPQPTVSFAAPSPQTYGINPSGSITIVGSNFILGATVTVGSLSGATVVGGNATAGVPFVHVSSAELRFYWPNTALGPGSYTITVTNPVVAGGLSGSRVGGFVVTAPTPTVSFASPSPQMYGINPSASVTIVGSNFILGATITVGSLSGATVVGGNATAGVPFVHVSSGELRFYWPNTALAPGSYTITVTNPAVAGGLSGSRVGGFVVTAPTPTVSFTAPTPVTFGVSPSQSITIVGSNFILGATITVGGLTGTTVAGTSATAGTPFVFQSSGQVHFYWPNTALPVAPYNVNVTNPAAAGGSAGNLANGFVVQ